MKKRLTLKSEHLVELTADELALAGGAAAEAYTGNPLCSFSVVDPCVSAKILCIETWLCVQTVQ